MKKKESLKRIKPKNQEVSEFDFLICPNCGETEVGKYCPNCGQSNKDYNKPVKDIVGDLLDSINIDVRLLNTLIPFFTKPGFLTEEYFKGRRKRYVPPMRMYMFVSIIFFFLVQYTSKDDIKNNIVKVNDNETKSGLVINSLKNDTTDTEGFVLDSLTTKDSSDNDIYLSDLEGNYDIFREEALKDTTTTEKEKDLIIGGLNAAEKKDVFFDKFMKNVSYLLFVLMPVFAVILALILWKSRMLYIKHLIFSINFHSFIFGLSIIILISNEILPESIHRYVAYLWFGIPLYLMLGIRRFYKRKYVGAFFKMIGALSLYSFLISIFIIILLLITIQGFV